MTRPTLFLILALAAISSIHAEGPPVEIMPALGLRGGADLESRTPGIPAAEADASATFGVEVDVALRADGWFEGFYDHQKLDFTEPAAAGGGTFDVNVDYLQFGGRYEPGQGKVRGFVDATLGLTHYGGSADFDNTLAFSGSIGGGVRIPMSKKLTLRLEVRGYGTFTDTALSVNCGPGCVTHFSAGGWYQVAGRAGLAIRL